MPDRGNILIVYDNSSSVKTLEELLTDTGYVVNRAVSGEEALAAIYVSEPNLILLGDHLPDIGPFALLKKLKQDQQTLYIPVIFLTAVDDTETRIKAVELGDDLITIPLEAREVLARVERQVTVSKVRMALRESETKFRSVMESAIDAIISADHTGHIVSWNNAATRILGYSPEETIGRRLEIIIPERFHEAHRKGMQRVTSGGESRVIGKTVELFARTKSGKEVPIELSLSTWTVREDRYYTGIIRDIRERKQAEEALRMSEQALRAKTQELKEKNDILGNALNKLQEIQNQLIMQEKMASLGKLSAGMAHELNNPAAAAQRGAAQLQALFVQLRDAYLKIDALKLEKNQIDKVIALGQLAGESANRPDDADALSRSDRESALEDWLEDKGLENAWQLASPLVSMGFDRSEIDQLAEHFTPNQFLVVIEWLSCTHTIHSLISEISIGTGRIVEIVKALKTYTFMDKAPIQSVDVHEGLDNTLIILKNKLKTGITVHREYAKDLPAINAYGSELNQVWTNIIDNAVDAMAGQGTLTLRTRREVPWIVVEIEDNGVGIAEEIQNKVFDPFFTTKAPGEGTGLGLNISRNIIVQKHQGRITVTSQPGKTRFTVRLPIDLHPAESQ